MSTPSLEEVIILVSQQRQRWNLGMPEPCSESDLDGLRARAHHRLNVSLPERYLDLLRITNGFDENGLRVFASQPLQVKNPEDSYFIDGVIEKNEELRADREGYDQLLIFAFDSLYVHGMDLNSGKYVMLAHDDEWPSRLFDTFEEMIVHAARRIIKS
jgi:hypothetical protein